MMDDVGKPFGLLLSTSNTECVGVILSQAAFNWIPVLAPRRNKPSWAVLASSSTVEPVLLNEAGIDPLPTVGTLKDGYIRRVPLPRVPPIQSTSPVACATIHRNPTHTGYSPIARIPTWSDMIESLSGFGRCIERYIPPFSPVRLM